MVNTSAIFTRMSEIFIRMRGISLARVTAVLQWQVSLNGCRFGIGIRSRAALWENWFLVFFSVKEDAIHRKLRIKVSRTVDNVL